MAEKKSNELSELLRDVGCPRLQFRASMLSTAINAEIYKGNHKTIHQ